MSWLERAACPGQDPKIFFPDPVSPSEKKLRRARDICHRCPVSEECLAFALRIEAGIEDPQSRPGIYGGLTPMERIARERGVA